MGCRQVIQICKYWRIKTINVVRRDDHVEELKALGADEIINSSTEGKSTNFSNLEYYDTLVFLYLCGHSSSVTP